jgi:hypothetical protein
MSATVTPLRTRKPTGRTGFPRILVEGGDKAGKSWSLAKLSASKKVGRTAVLILGEHESQWDEYGKIPGTRFEIALHDGTWSSIMSFVEWAKAEAAKDHAAGKPPFVLGVDSITAEWEGLKDWASLRCRGSKKNRDILEQDPDAQIDVSSNYWNDARARHRALMSLLLTFPGIVVLCARGSEVTLFENGQPVANKKTWSVESEKNLPYDVSVHVRLSRDARPLLVSAASVHHGIRPGIDKPKPLGDDWSLEEVIFDFLGLDAGRAQAGNFAEFKQERTAEEIRDEALQTTTTPERLRDLYREAAASKQLMVEVENGTGDMEVLGKLLVRLANERKLQAEQGNGGEQPQTRAPGAPAPAGPSGQQPPAGAAPAEVVTDTDWMNNLCSDRIPAAATAADLDSLRQEVAAKQQAGQCTETDAADILGLIGTRVDELTGGGERAA